MVTGEPDSLPILTLAEAAEQLVCSREHLLKLVDVHKLTPLTTFLGPTKREGLGVPPETMLALKRLLPAYAPDGWVTIYALHQLTGWTHDRVRRTLLKADIQPRSYRCAANGHVLDHYRQVDAVAILGYRPQQIPRAGIYLTANAMDQLLDRGEGWSARHLAHESYHGSATVMLDDTGAMRDHYSPAVLDRLRLESDQSRLKKAA